MPETDINQRVVIIAQNLLQDELKSGMTIDLINRQIESALMMKPSWKEQVDIEFVRNELIRRFSQFIGKSKLLKSEENHVAWLNAARKQDWRYWQRYREFLEEKLPIQSVDALDEVTDEILELLEEPRREGAWDRRGLVVGHVQSGKTSNYTGLICKAADAGYKIIIVLAGMHNNLRAQTQMRLDEGFLGYETHPSPDDTQPIGVSKFDQGQDIRPNYATNRTEKGDFNAAIARHLGIKPEQRPWLFVIKKNKSVLERLYRWLRNHVADFEDPDSKRRIITQLPLLLIDDEADNASVDTRQQMLKEDGTPDEEHNPTAINSLIRKILFSFARSAYVGYTATPFANIFIHDKGETKTEGPDLFPASFIINLASSSEYIGPVRVFGQRGTQGRESSLPLLREVADFANADGETGWMPSGHKSSHIARYKGKDTFPDSLREAINSFILACAIRNLRGQENEHSSMLVHVTRFNAVQQQVFEQIDQYLSEIKQRIRRKIEHQPILDQLKSLWEKDFTPTHREVLQQMAITRQLYSSMASDSDMQLPTWTDIESELNYVIQDIKIRMINGKAKDVLDYADQKGTGLKVIAIGGDKLARGLTLEGLCVSYFLRASRMYDTLMQMGRWFGYRPGYLDICRLYTSEELVEWFEHITDASEELREEFEYMAANNYTPKDYGLKVQSHPILLVTSPLKMRSTKEIRLSFSGELLETVVFHKSSNERKHNLEACRELIRKMGKPSAKNPEQRRGETKQVWTGYCWDNVSPEKIIHFLQAYKTHPDAHKVKSELLAKFIEGMNTLRELNSWTVILIGGGTGKKHSLADQIHIDMVKRKHKSKSKTSNDYRYTIGRLLSPRDESVDLDEASWKKAHAQTQVAWQADPARAQQKHPEHPSGPFIRKMRSREKGLLMIYLIDPDEAEIKDFSGPPVVGFGISFPESDSGCKVTYKINSVMIKEWSTRYGD